MMDDLFLSNHCSLQHQRPPHRSPIKPAFHTGSACISPWKGKFREQCNERIRRDREAHLWRRRSGTNGTSSAWTSVADSDGDDERIVRKAVYEEYLKWQESQDDFAKTFSSEEAQAVEAEILADIVQDLFWDGVDYSTIQEYGTVPPPPLPGHQGTKQSPDDVTMTMDDEHSGDIRHTSAMSDSLVGSSWKVGYQPASSHMSETGQARHDSCSRADTPAMSQSCSSRPASCFVCQRGILFKQTSDPAIMSCSSCDLHVRTASSVKDFLYYVLDMCRLHEGICSGQSLFSYTPQDGLSLFCNTASCREPLHLK
ncbi:hypothetical protein SeLEV6574_g05177 [Synchytrium endobioticum]|uniref:Uncharacterized protein n=1 Tax=Synchytrium endobioticum TaxID=286115 RepID=A0A507CVQ3_9FUNG|nr:hypothetical protein SeLEV6574_g05177 [Synchytrium endobioticum]